MSGLYKLNLTCQLITPMFMAGADGRTPELRPSEFKGMMRWWWRAIKAESNYKQLLEEENKIFGGTGKGEGKSKVNIAIYPNKLEYSSDIISLIQGYDGIKYLLYSTFTLKSRGEPIVRKFFTPKQEFNLSLVSFDKKSFDNACASLWLSIYFGGFGTRARRGGGTLEILAVSGGQELKFTSKIKNKSELKNFLEENFQKIKSMMSNSNSKIEYTNLKGLRVFIFNPENDWRKALNSIGKKFRSFRNDHKSEIFETAAFGMPVMHSKFSVRLVPYKNIVGKRFVRLSDRWSSPLIFKVIKSENNYFPVIVKLSPGGFDTIGKEIRINSEWRLDNNRTSAYSEKLINKFLQTLSDAEELEL